MEIASGHSSSRIGDTECSNRGHLEVEEDLSRICSWYQLLNLHEHTVIRCTSLGVTQKDERGTDSTLCYTLSGKRRHRGHLHLSHCLPSEHSCNVAFVVVIHVVNSDDFNSVTN